MAKRQASKTPASPRHHYEALGCYRGSSEERLRQAWREKSRELHPDRHVGDPAAASAMTSAFAAASQAWAVLGDEAKRKAYDVALDAASLPCEACEGEGATYRQRGFTERVATVCEACGGSGRAERKKFTRRK